ncbi:2-succinyl-5-enolpyruvyl-6-hydroxy-3-cyclohexene-1-carboxylic-acid synthase [Halorhodospira halochloris]|uniref:2-succinyl-5-enolpyruvyl-6-hydroxy-3- cyclohexene-1-carboxylic-acid synthase n=1 Tax=Halorhodospira halochloris TaxID=1052 RepID=UPI001EE87EFA|nr:2-succinyl-5-enolpyruvyl-6-hydroxy-3-cyclohexene-1-carboxylic-acid synthase [Halorhodospira halochloris]MCG5530858.1 2-succinyl-5-enolpyruvyl-6-hydroxy-3-cyclohexene-1-carboxylic-acid synthase [Halorhodospira halochloris]
MDEALYDLNAAWADSIVNRLLAHDVRDVCIAPGSRSAPLALAAGRMSKAEPRLRIHTHFDERGLAFYALGLSRQTGRPCAVITTSGTAVPNLYPALTEARHSYLPLIALTADRPPELLNCGANQAIDQVELFAPQARASLNLPPPDDRLGPLWLARRIDSALERARDPADGGPVHINVQFREPLYGGGEAIDEHAWQQQLPSPAPRPAAAPHHDPQVEIRPPLLFVAGSLDDEQAQAVLNCAERASIPILADISSQLRLLEHPCVIGGSELLLATTCGREALNAAHQIWQFGGRLTGKRIAQWLTYTNAEHYLVSPRNDYLDPAWRAKPIQADIVSFCASIEPPEQPPIANLDKAIGQVRGITLPRLSKAEKVPSEGSTGEDQESGFDELVASHIIATELPKKMALFPGNSLAIRLFDLLATPRHGNTCITQRGASGIDGLIATAAGHAARHPAGVTLVIGDLSALHDLNSLALAAAAEHPLAIVVLNNDGGGIFDMLPARGQGESHKQLFRMPHGFSFEHAAAQFRLPYHLCADANRLRQAYRKACQTPGATVIEVACPPQQGCDRLGELMRSLEAAPEC